MKFQNKLLQFLLVGIVSFGLSINAASSSSAPQEVATTLFADEQFSIPEFLQKINYGLTENKIEAIADGLDALFSALPREFADSTNDKEAFYHALTHTVFRLTGHRVASEQPTGAGELDTCIETKNGKNLYIFEFKREKNYDKFHMPVEKKYENQRDISIKALRQIFARDYYKAHHQDGIPMTFAGIAFHKLPSQKFPDYNNFICSMVSMEQNPTTWRVYSFLEPNKAIENHGEVDKIFDYIKTNWSYFKVTRSESELKTPRAYTETNEGLYHNNLQNIRSGILDQDIPLIIKNIECIIHSIPWPLRLHNSDYYSAVMYTAFLCAGVNPVFIDNKITITTQKRNFIFLPSFSEDFNKDDINLFVLRRLLKESKINPAASGYLIASNINKESHGVSKSKITFFSKWLKVGKKHYRDDNYEKICKIGELEILEDKLFNPNSHIFSSEVKSPATHKKQRNLRKRKGKSEVSRELFPNSSETTPNVSFEKQKIENNLDKNEDKNKEKDNGKQEDDSESRPSKKRKRYHDDYARVVMQRYLNIPY